MGGTTCRPACAGAVLGAMQRDLLASSQARNRQLGPLGHGRGGLTHVPQVGHRPLQGGCLVAVHASGACLPGVPRLHCLADCSPPLHSHSDSARSHLHRLQLWTQGGPHVHALPQAEPDA